MSRSFGNSTRVSVVIPAYKPYFFRQCLQSVLADQGDELEIIISDDCPTDDIKLISSDYPSITYVKNPVAGHYSNFDNCLRLAKGDFVKFLFDDDVLKSGCIPNMLAAERAQSVRPALIASAYERIGEDGVVQAVRGFTSPEDLTVMAHGSAIVSILYAATNFIGALSSVLLPASTLRRLGPEYFVRRMRSKARGLSDVALYLDVGRMGPVLYMRQPQAQFRHSRFNLTNTGANGNAVLTLKAWFHLIEEARAQGLLVGDVYAGALRNVLTLYAKWVPTFPELELEREAATRRLAEHSPRTALRE